MENAMENGHWNAILMGIWAMRKDTLEDTCILMVISRFDTEFWVLSLLFDITWQDYLFNLAEIYRFDVTIDDG